MRKVDDDKRHVDKSKWRYIIDYWLGKPRAGEWVPEPILTSVKRTFTNQSREANGDLIRFEELIHAHHGYRPKLADEKGTRKAFFFRGARVWRGQEA